MADRRKRRWIWILLAALVALALLWTWIGRQNAVLEQYPPAMSTGAPISVDTDDGSPAASPAAPAVPARPKASEAPPESPKATEGFDKRVPLPGTNDPTPPQQRP